MRGGSSRGPYFNRQDLPEDRDTLSEVLISLIGAGHPFNIDGIGGGKSVTTKVAILSASTDGWADVDYFFAQVGVEKRQVDYRPTCGNILSGVGPAAIEMGLVPASTGQTTVNIRAVNTGARIVARVLTPEGEITYDGDTAIDGVPGTAAPVELLFMDTAGGVTGSMLPTGNPVDIIEGVEVTCMDLAMPVVIARAGDFDLTGFESAAELDENRLFFEKMQSVRLEAGRRMGMGDVRESVTPKFALIGPPRSGGSFSARYFMPWQCHPSMAVTGAQCLAGCFLFPGSVAQGLCAPQGSPARVVIEHPAGEIEVIVDYSMASGSFVLKSTGLVRTARKIASGELFIPGAIWK